MAYWQRKKNNHVFVYTHRKGKTRVLPRSETKHLDGQPDHNIDAWVRNYELTVEGRLPGVKPKTDPHLTAEVEAYISYLKLQDKDPSTVDYYKKSLLDRVMPFFLSHEPPLIDPVQWPGVSAQMLAYLVKQGTSFDNILRANTALKGFWDWLGEEGKVPFNAPPLRLRRPVREQKNTPLQYTLTPEEVLEWVKNTQDKELKLMALLGYFFSLRPFEIFGAKKSFFQAGTQAAFLECGKSMQQLGLFHKLAIFIGRARKARKKSKDDTEKFKKPKTAVSKGWVACFNADAARLAVELINSYPPDHETFFAHGPRYNQDKWKEQGIAGMTLKDLRRASLYWLGHHTDFAKYPILMQKHARHKKLETTLLYLRRPEESTEPTDSLDLDA